jgi:uncharacterized membrane protein YidH (DUF202 family)
MKTCNGSAQQEAAPFAPLVEEGLLSAEELAAAGAAAACRDIELERILHYEYDIPRRKLLEALSWHHRCAWIEYDERLPVPPELLQHLEGNRLCLSLWFPVIRDGETVIIAAHSPHDPIVHEEAKQFIPAAKYEFRVALAEDILALIQDFLNATPDHIIGNERTGLAFWRNTLARWRTRLACYRTDFAEARTYLSLLRGGLGLITIGRALMRSGKADLLTPLYWMMILTGFATVLLGLYSYRRIKTSIMSPPKHQTLVEVTAATLYVLENYQFVDAKPVEHTPKATMLARLADMLPNSCVFIEPSLDNKVRSYLAHERTSLAAQRTVLGCYRTIYARARTGLSFIRTGVAFMSIGFGLIEYFGLSVLTVLDLFLIVAGLLMTADGTVWYWPIRKEQHEAAKCAVVC